MLKNYGAFVSYYVVYPAQHELYQQNTNALKGALSLNLYYDLALFAEKQMEFIIIPLTIAVYERTIKSYINDCRLQSVPFDAQLTLSFARIVCHVIAIRTK